jgi:Spy/CpxP family protein refolding chaperone
MKRRFIPFAAAAALAAGLAFAQAPAASPAHPRSGRGHASRMAEFHQRMMSELNLTDAQKAQAKTIFQGEREKAKPLVEQLRQDRQAMREAVKTNDTARIHSLAAKEGKTRGELSALRSEAQAKFYATLTPEQRTKADQLHQQAREKMRQRGQQQRTGE